MMRLSVAGEPAILRGLARQSESAGGDGERALGDAEHTTQGRSSRTGGQTQHWSLIWRLSRSHVASVSQVERQTTAMDDEQARALAVLLVDETAEKVGWATTPNNSGRSKPI
jgi:hypothetical protein